MPQPAGRAHSHKDLPPSVETAYYRKCIELRRRIHDIEENNDATRLRISRLNRAIMKMRLERAFLLEQLHKRMEYNIDDSDRSTSPPPTPTDKPLRSKRTHRQKTPPQGTQGSSVAGGAQQHSPGSLHQPVVHALNPMSSAQSTPDPSRSAPFFNNPPPASSPHAVNGNSVHAHSGLQSSHQSSMHTQRPTESSRGAFYDPTQDDQHAAGSSAEYSERRRTLSGSHAPPPDSQNSGSHDQDTEMADASRGAVGESA
ncbi:uncharacterized protein EI97DRAFT_469574 [Westerdykella ornata]|uniref:INO80 complex subunit F domain-containing protein n=1 Tax=Westerdykella ornata TaxID=318751 RepID=A0A6A6J9X8_WESOR|nr:uncharacterized protein EI97DRAFT_469574 [Westerdykella ornata]KAF2273381.1 hypothetical protein EI97DRAFT_469574 [Westerdykella ornata]